MTANDSDVCGNQACCVLSWVKGTLAVGLTVAVTAAVARTLSAPPQSARPALQPFSKRYDGHVLSANQVSQLEDGNKVLMSAREVNAGGGRGTAVCDIAAPPSVVWQTILAFDRYPGRLAQCKAARVYDRRKTSLTTESIKVHMTLDGLIRDFNCYYDHTWTPKKNVLTWTLDPDHASDFVDVQGQWCVDKHPSKRDWSRVWYSADVKLPPWLPRLVIVQLCKSSGTKALAFCKQEAETRFAAAPSRSTNLPRFPTWAKLRGGGGGLGPIRKPPW